MKKNKNILNFKGKSEDKKIPANGDILNQGKFGKLDYVLYKRGNIHITDGKLTFKKDADTFEDTIEELELNNMTDGERKVIEGAGDNPNLVFTCDGDNITMKLENKGYPLVEKLMNVLGMKTKKKIAKG